MNRKNHNGETAFISVFSGVGERQHVSIESEVILRFTYNPFKHTALDIIGRPDEYRELAAVLIRAADLRDAADAAQQKDAAE